jgi:hypothetical protein
MIMNELPNSALDPCSKHGITMKHKTLSTSWFTAIAAFLLTSCAFTAPNDPKMMDTNSSKWQGTKHIRVVWRSPPCRINIEQFYNSGNEGYEFSSDSKLICIWKFPDFTDRDYHFRPATYPVQCAVFDLNGQLQGNATNGNGFLTDLYKAQFPKTFRRQACSDWFSSFGTNTSDYVVMACNVSPDNTLGMRIVAGRKGVDPHTEGFSPIVELWRLSPIKVRIWSKQIPERTIFENGLVDCFQMDNKTFILAAFQGRNAFVLSQDTGDIVDRFTYGPEETEAELRAREKLFRLDARDDFVVRFQAGYLAFDPERRVLALGDAYDMRLRIVSVDPPHAVLFEAHTSENHHTPWPGDWTIMSVGIEAHKFVVVSYMWANRLFGEGYDCEEAFSLDTRKLVWSATNDGISFGSPYVSPDGKMMAIGKDKWLEIGPASFGD